MYHHGRDIATAPRAGTSTRQGWRRRHLIAARYNATPRQIALAWLLKRSPMILPIPGTLSLEPLKENIAALQIALTDADFDVLR